MRSDNTPTRPPGTVSEALLDGECTRCDACIARCPAGILVAGGGGLPVIDFARGACTFCGGCAEVCEPKVIRPATSRPERARIGESCLEGRGITCRLCESACDALAFRFRPTLGGRTAVTIDPACCTGCGGCVAACPVGAIRISELEPERSPCTVS